MHGLRSSATDPEHRIQTTLSTAFLLPVSPHLAVYYYALITDLCKLSPGTVGPAVGKSIRKLYRLLEDSAGKDAGALDVETAKRFGEWFAVHMGNFGFSWVWKEWYVHQFITQEIRFDYIQQDSRSVVVAVPSTEEIHSESDRSRDQG